MLTREWLTLDRKSHLYRQSVIGFPSGVFNPARLKTVVQGPLDVCGQARARPPIMMGAEALRTAVRADS